jgi:hypothetical protein
MGMELANWRSIFSQARSVFQARSWSLECVALLLLLFPRQKCEMEPILRYPAFPVEIKLDWIGLGRVGGIDFDIFKMAFTIRTHHPLSKKAGRKLTTVFIMLDFDRILRAW